tara:strand:- start:654 stop:794 length:141 start_codon:yes stop_codon:yes gene_type:complete
MTYKLTVESSPPPPAPTAGGGDVSSLKKYALEIIFMEGLIFKKQVR